MAIETEESRRARTARRAYEIWERRGRPAQHELDHWLAAEEELRDEPLSGDSTPPVTNLDRALPPAGRTQVRDQRRVVEARTPAPEPPPAEHFVILADRAGVHILAEDHPPGQRTATLRILQHQVFPLGHEGYADRDSAPQGRFPHSPRRGGMSIDERLPMQQEQERRLIDLIGRTIAGFLRQHPAATWDFAAGAPLHRALLDQLAPDMRRRLRRLLPKELTGQPVESLAGHLATAPPYRT